MIFDLRRPAIAALTILAAVATGCSSQASAGGTIATVNGQPIARADLDKQLEASPQAKSIVLNLIRGALVDQYATQNNINITDADVQKKIDDIKSKYPPGQFDQLVKQNGLTMDDLKTIFKRQLIVQAAVDKDIHVTDEQIKAYFDQNHKTLDTPAQIRARHILVPDLATAQSIEQKLKAGAKFEDLAKQYSTDPGSKDKGGELGFFSKGQMVAPFEQAAETQPIGVVGPPVKSPFGYHIIEVEERKPATVATLASAHDKIADLLKQQQENLAVPQFFATLQEKAKIDISDDRFKDVLPPAAPAAPATPPATPAPAASK